MSRETNDALPRGRSARTLTIGWIIVLGLGGWLVVEAATTLYASRDRFVDGPVEPSQQQPQTRRAAERGVEALDTRKSRGVVVLLRALERAQASADPGTALGDGDVLRAYEELGEGDVPSPDRLANQLDRACTNGLVRRRPGKGYALTEDGRRLLKRDRR